jgi:hypothetical protein
VALGRSAVWAERRIAARAAATPAAAHGKLDRIIAMLGQIIDRDDDSGA